MGNYHKVCNENKELFMQLWKKTTRCSDEDALAGWENESYNFTKIVENTTDLSQSTELSLISSFIDLAVTGLSLNAGAKCEAYLEARSVCVDKRWTKVCRLVISVYGELNMRIRSGQITRVSNPIVIYEGDKFQPRTNENGDLIIDYATAIPRKSNKIIGCWVMLTLPNGGRDYKWLLEDDILRLQRFSTPRATNDKPNPKPNNLYGSNNGQIDTGFLEAKTIKHALRSYTKLKVSETTALEGDDECERESPQETFAPTVESKKVVVEDDNEIF